MKPCYKLFFTTIALALFSSISWTQNKEITLNEIWGGSFHAKQMEHLNPMKNGSQYTIRNGDENGIHIDLYNYSSLKKSKTLFSTKDNKQIKFVTEYIFNKNESKLLIAPTLKSIYRHSKKGIYYLYDIRSKSTKSIADIEVQGPTFSPNNTHIAYVHDNNLYVKEITNLNKEIAVTEDGEKNKIINGITDWVYEEEFAFTRAYQWNSTGDKIAYLKFNESEVPNYSMDMYRRDSLYPSKNVFKYPKAGENNSKVSLHIYDLKSQTTTDVMLESYYIPRILWTKNPNILSVQTLNRHQNNLKLHFYHSDTNKIEVVLNETDKAYIDITDDLFFLDDNSFIWSSEKDNWKHLYHYSSKGKLIQQITKGNWDVTSFYGYNPKNKKLYYQSTETGSIYRDVYVVSLSGKDKRKLSTKKGTNSSSFSTGMKYFINNYSNTTTPNIFTLHRASDGKKLKTIIDNKELAERIKQYKLPKKEFKTTSVYTKDLNTWIITPTDFDDQKNYPLLMAQYSGPGSQQVADKWLGTNDFWYMMLAQKGYFVACVDGRGTGFKGAKFKKSTYLQLGKNEVEDQTAAARILGDNYYIDENRIGIWGWSYGGFMSSNCILQQPDIFSLAIAVAPVTSWRYYDTIYTERYMRTPQENPKGYDENSPITYARNLKGKYLLVHGSADDNVHLQNSMRMIDELVKYDKPFDWAIYTDKNHGIYGGKTRLHLYKKMTDFILNNL